MISETGVKIYRPNQRLRTGWLKTWWIMVKNIYISRELIYQLFKRDFFVVYKKSFIGIGWVLISPIIGIVSWAFMNLTGILDPGDVGVPYPVYVLISSSFWGLFMGFYSAGGGTLSAGAGFINQVKYPHEALLIKQTLQHLVNFMISFAINLVVLFIFRVTPSWEIVLFPVLILPLFFFGAAVGLLTSVISVVATDITSIVDKSFAFIFFLTPIIYSAEDKDATLQKVIAYNPLTYLIGGMRDLILFGHMDDFQTYLAFSLAAFIFFLIALRLFYISEDRVIEKMI